MKYYLIAGEASGDLHAANLMRALQMKSTDAQFRIWGGDHMEAAGGKLVNHYRHLAFMGFWEVAKNLRTILRYLRQCKEDIQAYQPDALILVDYPGFNLRIARWAKQAGFRVFYYISPQVWAWKAQRVHKIKASVDRLFSILPFEQAFYKQYGYQVDFVGHPLLDAIANTPLSLDFRQQHQLSEAPIIALLPGSRKQEITRMLKGMLAVVPRFPDYQFVIAGAPAIPDAFYQNLMQQAPASAKLLHNQTYSLLQQAKAALVTSGTATLETALFQVPQVVCYSGNWLSYRIAKRLIKVPYISLTNLIADKPIVTELIQQDFNPDRLTQELHKLLQPAQAAVIQKSYQALRQQLGDVGASERTATLILNDLRKV